MPYHANEKCWALKSIPIQMHVLLKVQQGFLEEGSRDPLFLKNANNTSSCTARYIFSLLVGNMTQLPTKLFKADYCFSGSPFSINANFCANNSSHYENKLQQVRTQITSFENRFSQARLR